MHTCLPLNHPASSQPTCLPDVSPECHHLTCISKSEHALPHPHSQHTVHPHLKQLLAVHSDWAHPGVSKTGGPHFKVPSIRTREANCEAITDATIYPVIHTRSLRGTRDPPLEALGPGSGSWGGAARQGVGDGLGVGEEEGPALWSPDWIVFRKGAVLQTGRGGTFRRRQILKTDCRLHATARLLTPVRPVLGLGREQEPGRERARPDAGRPRC